MRGIIKLTVNVLTYARRDILAHDWVSIRRKASFLLRRMATTLQSFLHYLRTELTNASDLKDTRYLSAMYITFLSFLCKF